MEFTREEFKALCARKNTTMTQAARNCNAAIGSKFTTADISRYFVERHFGTNQVIGLIEGAGATLQLTAPDGVFTTDVKLNKLQDLVNSIMYTEDISFAAWVRMCNPILGKKWDTQSANRSIKKGTIRFYKFNILMEVIGYQLSIKE